MSNSFTTAEEPDHARAVDAISTSGECFLDGTIIDRLRDNLLIAVNEGEVVTGTTLAVGDRTYAAAPLCPELEKALCLPTHLANYDSTGQLFARLSQAAQQHVGLDADQARLLASWIMATHLMGALPMPLLNPHGDAVTATTLMRFLAAVCYHPLALTQPTLRELLALPQGLAPTLLLTDAPASLVRALLNTLGGPGGGFLRAGRLIRLQGAAALCSPAPLPLPVLPLSLAGATPRAGALSASTVAALADEYQPQLLQFRLQQWLVASQTSFDIPDLAPSLRTMARSLGAALIGAPEAQAQLEANLHLLDEQARVEHSQGTLALVVEILYQQLHDQGGSAYLQDVTQAVNAILRNRHERLQLTSKEVAALVRGQLNLNLKRVSAGYEIVLDTAASQRIHQMARILGLALSRFPDHCPACEEEDSVAA